MKLKTVFAPCCHLGMADGTEAGSSLVLQLPVAVEFGSRPGDVSSGLTWELPAFMAF